MRAFTIVLFMCICIIASTFAAVAIIPADKTPGHPGHCNSDLTGPLEKGETKQLKDCTIGVCSDDGSIHLESCSPFQAPGCEIVEDKGKPYPDCCPKPVCKSS
ncbi:U-scoloptoxin(16)-Ssd1a [Aethina tumida]|uniref:U-scoloptoxin(16)-Ssd1a n=1 Tax=Aethina tumida TaxID=116153 RepID=UPI00096B1EC4|nr:U-scoloptoxin(16)-Ssd1a [Aethina tumida]